MGNKIWNIVKKECDRFFKDRRMVFTTILMPALLIYAMYSVMGAGFSNMETVDRDYVPQCYVQHLPQSFAPVLDALGFDIIETTDPDRAKDRIREESADLLVVFPEGFDAMLRQPGEQAQAANIAVYYDSTVNESAAAYELFLAAAEQFESSLVNILDVNRDIADADLATDSDIVSATVASILPMLIIMLLFSGCISVAPESIAGEKERGTIATLLVTPVSRTDIAIGKIVSLSLFALLSGLSSFTGVILSLPKMFGDSMGEVNMGIYGIGDYGALLCVIASTVLLIVSLISVLSACAKSVKEATTLVSPLMILSTLLGLVRMFSIDFSGIGWRFVPILNSILCISDILSFHYSTAHIAVTCAANAVYMLILAAALSKMFNSESVMFKK